jgi:hypothetical protein
MFILEGYVQLLFRDAFDFNGLFFSWHSEHAIFHFFVFPQFSFLILLQLMRHHGESISFIKYHKTSVGARQSAVLVVLGDFGLFNFA